MSGIYPRAAYRPLGPQTQAEMRAHDIVCLHTMVGSLWGTDAYFRDRGFAGTESHFGVGHDGEVLQWQHCGWRADANLNGNDHVISIETADYGDGFPPWDTHGSDVPAWTHAQLDAIADIVAWCCDTYDIPCVLIPNSRPGYRGIGYHRQGVPGYMVSGGERWSNRRGKVCPGDRRIAQIPEVIERATRLLGGAATPVRKKDPMTAVPLPVADDLTFRATTMTEAGEASAVAAGAWATFGSTWGATAFTLTALRGDGHIIYQWQFNVVNNFYEPLELPPATKMVTFEGTVETRSTLPAAAVWTIPK